MEGQGGYKPYKGFLRPFLRQMSYLKRDLIYLSKLIAANASCLNHKFELKLFVRNFVNRRPSFNSLKLAKICFRYFFKPV